MLVAGKNNVADLGAVLRAGRSLSSCASDRWQLKQTMPLDVRRRPLCEQIDVVWGGQVLPNMHALKSVQYDFIQLQQGDLRVLQSGGNVAVI